MGLVRTAWTTELSNDVETAIYKYCLNRNYKCKGCRFSIDKYTKDHSEYVTCVFANCPCSWFEEV